MRSGTIVTRLDSALPYSFAVLTRSMYNTTTGTCFIAPLLRFHDITRVSAVTIATSMPPGHAIHFSRGYMMPLNAVKSIEDWVDNEAMIEIKRLTNGSFGPE